jgi:hypothetical protein
MVAAPPEIDRLIEEGLTLYGRGDLDGALLSWEQVLAIDPENPQANSYVDYVRMNYELLTTEVHSEETSAPFGIGDDEPEYQIEILPGDPIVQSTPPPLYMDPLDEGWYIEDESGRIIPRTISQDDPPLVTLEIEADEPPLPEPEPPSEPPPISFDDATREYPGGPPANKSRELATFDDSVAEPVTSEFQPEGTPGFGSPSDYMTPPGGFGQVTPGFETLSSGFGTQVTDVRKRDLGFVQPAADNKPAGPPELKMTLRTPDHLAHEDDAADPSVELGPPPASSMVELSYDDPPTSERRPVAPPPDDLIASLPSPTPAGPALGIRPIDPATGLPQSGTTRDLPAPTRTPAPVTAEMPAQGASTRDFPEQKTEKLPPGVRFSVPTEETPLTHDLPAGAGAASRHPTADTFSGIGGAGAASRHPAADTFSGIGGAGAASRHPTADTFSGIGGKAPAFSREMVSAPTRDLGIRPDKRPPTEDEPTLAKPRSDDGTRADVILPFDPIDARSAQILDDIDVGAPANEAKEDRTRRRISTLFEHATEWSRGGELDRAVAAVDLALSEDPNSALAQKLIHRNRDTMMNVFQAFLGDLQRQPMLARPLHELAAAPISPRAAFLLSRVDGLLSLDEILDVSGMPRLEAYRYLCQLFLRGILR